MTCDPTEIVLSRIEEAADLYHRLVLLVGPPRSGKTPLARKLASTKGWPFINVNLALSERLLDLTRKQRAIHLPRHFEELVREQASEVVVLDNIELLFAAELELDPLRLLGGLSRHRTVVATWAGHYEKSILTYAQPGHPEARSDRNPDALILSLETLGDASASPADPSPRTHDQEMA